MRSYLSLLLLGILLALASGDNLDLDRGVLVHMFEWRYADIARECENVLGPQGFKGVQISPPSENLVISGRPWYERYQPISYKLVTRSGTREELEDMLNRCNKVGIRVIADVIVNHMTAEAANCVGTANTRCNSSAYSYPGVPYSENNFHLPHCNLDNFNNITEVRVCNLVTLKDLNQTQEYVRKKILAHLNELIDLGVGGLRLDAAKHVFPENLQVIYSRLNYLNTSQGFSAKTQPFIYQEVTHYGAVLPKWYINLGMVTEFNYALELSNCFQNRKNISLLKDFGWGTSWDFLPENKSLVFVENHDTERDTVYGILNYKISRSYKMALAFMLAWPFGTPLILSSYRFSKIGRGPPKNKLEQTLSPYPIIGNTCSNGWECQHRYRQVINMVTFRNIVRGTNVTSWWDNGSNQISFCRGTKGFIAFNMNTKQPLHLTLQTCLPPGTYCDVISGNVLWGVACSGKVVEVRKDGTAQIFISKFDPKRRDDGVLALHVGASLKRLTHGTSIL